eukprot:1043838-Ditylum_brightwellii.AAC.1
MDTLLQQHEQGEENKMDEYKNSAYTISIHISRHGCSLPRRSIPTTTKTHINNTSRERTQNWPELKLGSTVK